MGRARTLQRGFTLLEAAVVLAIVALTMLFIGPRFAGLRDGAAVRSAMTDLGATISAGRSLAMTRGAMTAVVFDAANGVVEVRIAGEAVVRRELGRAYGIVLGSNRDSTVYDPRGIGYGAANLSVTVRRGAFVDTLTMSRLGRVR